MIFLPRDFFVEPPSPLLLPSPPSPTVVMWDTASHADSASWTRCRHDSRGRDYTAHQCQNRSEETHMFMCTPVPSHVRNTVMVGSSGQPRYPGFQPSVNHPHFLHYRHRPAAASYILQLLSPSQCSMMSSFTLSCLLSLFLLSQSEQGLLVFQWHWTL